MSDSESDVSGNELLKDWSVVNELGDVESDDSFEAVTINDGSALFHHTRRRSSSLGAVEEHHELETRNMDTENIDDMDDAVDVELGLNSSTVHPIAFTNVSSISNRSIADAEQSIPVAEESHSDNTGHHSDSDSLSSGSSIEVLDIAEDLSGVNISSSASVFSSLGCDSEFSAELSSDLLQSGLLSSIQKQGDIQERNSNDTWQFQSVDTVADVTEGSIHQDAETDYKGVSGTAGGASAEMETNCHDEVGTDNEETEPILKGETECDGGSGHQFENHFLHELKSNKFDCCEDDVGGMSSVELSCTLTASDSPNQNASAQADRDNNDAYSGPQAELNAGGDSDGEDSDEINIHDHLLEVDTVDDAAQINMHGQFAGGQEGSISARNSCQDCEDDDADETVYATEDMADENVDDRCESDISGVATDDTDLSTVSNIGDICLANCHAVRSYRHQPNPSVNAKLTYTAFIALIFACGIGIGHYMASTRVSTFAQHQFSDLQFFRDHYFLCHSKLDYSFKMAEERLMQLQQLQHKYEDTVAERDALRYELDNQLLNTTRRGFLAYSELVRYKLAARSYKKLLLCKTKLNELQLQHSATGCVGAHMNTKFLEDRLIEAHTVCNNVTAQLNDAIEGLKNTANRLKMENADLRDYIRVLRYAKHPGNGDDIGRAVEKEELNMWKNSVNQLKIENDDLKAYVRSLRYDAYQMNGYGKSRNDSEGRDVSVEDNDKYDLASNQPDVRQYDRLGNVISENSKLNDVKEELTSSATASHSVIDWAVEFQRMQLLFDNIGLEWRSGHRNGAHQRQREPSGQDLLQPPIFITFLKHLLSLASNSTGVSLTLEKVRLITNCVEILKNSSAGESMVEIMISTWDQVIGSFPTSHPRYSQMKAAVDTCRQQMDAGQTSTGGKGGTNSPRVEEVFRRYVNKTFETVSKLSNAIQTTLDRMRTIPDELFAENKTAKKIAQKVTGFAARLENQVRGGWNKFSDNLKRASNEWFGSNKKRNTKNGTKQAKCPNKKSCDPSVPNKKDGNKNGTTQTKRRPNKRSTGSSVTEKNDKSKAKSSHNDENAINVGQQLNDANVKSFSQRRHKENKQTRSDRYEKNAPRMKRDGPLRYEDFWEDDKYDPDDYLPDGFFEGNHREWRRQHERRLRAVHGRLQRLNEDIFISMDDDDVEDLHEMIEDFADDTQHRDEPGKFRTWISCQERWWKSRLHRKHRSEDIITACGNQLMHWQLRVLCKGLREDEKPVKECNFVLSPHASDSSHNTFDSQSVVDARRPSAVHKRSKGDTGVISDERFSITTPRRQVILDSDSQNADEVKVTCPEKKVTSVENGTRYDGADGADWYFRLAQHREDVHQPAPDWYFNLMEERELERSDASWYVRSIRHKSVQHVDGEE